MIKQFYFKLFTFTSVKVKWFQELLYSTNYAIKRQSFIHIQLNDKTVLFQTIYFQTSQS